MRPFKNFARKKMFEQILITEYQENSLGLPLAVPKKTIWTTCRFCQIQE